MKKIKVKLSESNKKIGRTNWASLKKTDTAESNKKIQPTQKTRG
ncbi:hypothetical protein MNBD_GAMMA08-482 [hydrothermal vent metagenome]|uniref:Uncharacterized protein n=1 Tax=hydrothermal vent metagenome TaxID=652676 RepID=A0A3B0WV18_9ZZZZ